LVDEWEAEHGPFDVDELRPFVETVVRAHVENSVRVLAERRALRRRGTPRPQARDGEGHQQHRADDGGERQHREDVPAELGREVAGLLEAPHAARQEECAHGMSILPSDA
jgi:hypothetical protein